MISKVYFQKANAFEEESVLARKTRKVYLAAGLNEKIHQSDFVALKIHFGESGNKGYIKPGWLTGLISEVKKKSPHVFLTDTNTLYVGNRSNAVDHIRLAWEHGFTPDVVGIPVIIADGLIGRDKLQASADAGLSAAVGKTKVKKEGSPLKIASAILDSDVLICLTHVTGHVQTGLGAALKNMGMGCASRAGKLDQHSVVHPQVAARKCRNCGICLAFCPEQAIIQVEGHVEIDGRKCVGCGECLVVCKHDAVRMRWDEDSARLQEKMAEYAHRIYGHFKGKAVFLNFLIKITKNCDCMARDERRIVEDIGIVSSSDPVAADQATADLILRYSQGKDVLRAGYKIDWSRQLKHAEALGLGSTKYELVELD